MKKSFYSILLISLLLFACQSKEMKKAKAYMDASMYNEAASLLEIEIQDKPKNAEASFLLGLCFYNIGNYDKTDVCFKRAILLETDYKGKIGTFFYDKALELVKKKDIETSMRFYNQALDYNPIGKDDFASRLYSYATTEIEISTESEPIIRIFTLIKKITTQYNQKIAEITFSKAKIFIEKGFPEDGFKFAEFSIINDPKHIKDLASLYLEYGQTLSKSPEKCLNSIEYFERSIELDNSNKMKISEIYYNISNEYLQSNNTNIALIFGKKAMDINESYNKWYSELRIKYTPKVPVTSNLPKNGLIAYYPFNGNSNDYSGNSFHLLNNGGSSSSDRFHQSNMAYYFNSNSYMENTRGVDVSSSFSISVWIKPDTYNNYSQPVTVGYRNGNNIRITYKPQNNTVGFDAWLGGATGVFSKATVPSEIWTHVVGVRNESNWKVYLNGSLDNSSSGSSESISNAIIKIADFLGVAHFNGSVDEIRIYNRTLSDNEVYDIYNNSR